MALGEAVNRGAVLGGGGSSQGRYLVGGGAVLSDNPDSPDSIEYLVHTSIRWQTTVEYTELPLQSGNSRLKTL